MSVILRKSWVNLAVAVLVSFLLVSVVSAEEFTKLDVDSVTFPESQELILDLPEGWGVEKATTMGGSIEITNYYFLNEEGEMTFKLNYPLREIGYEPTDAENRRTLPTEAGFELDVVDRIMRDDQTTGFGHYMYSGGDYWQDSFEIFVPFREELYDRTADEHQSGGGLETKYKTYQEYLDGEGYAGEVEGVLVGITKAGSVTDEDKTVDGVTEDDTHTSDSDIEVENTESEDVETLRAQLMRLIEMLQQLLQLQSLLGR